MFKLSKWGMKIKLSMDILIGVNRKANLSSFIGAVKTKLKTESKRKTKPPSNNLFTGKIISLLIYAGLHLKFGYNIEYLK